ncbi:MAG: hypothetical protein M1838_003368 [Thelocarpon superellum]|nr:MAG: hypothetical protein M1838_003368 [Thelocarpon superellum]
MRTAYLPTSILLVVLEIGTRLVQSRRAYILWLSDGQLAMQALLVPEMHRFVLTGEIAPRSLVCLANYTVRKARRVGAEGVVAYLAVSDLRTVGQCDESPYESPVQRTAKSFDQKRAVNTPKRKASYPAADRSPRKRIKTYSASTLLERMRREHAAEA